MQSEPIRLLVFDVTGDYGHFRKINTTSSPLTYSLPTRVAIAGLLGAILGIERETGPGKFPEGVTPTQEVFAKKVCGIAVQVLRPVSKTVIGFNLLMTSKSFFEIENRTQIPFELVKYPAYRIFFTHQDAAVFDELKDRLTHKRYHFSPYLGLSQFTCQIHFQGEKRGLLKSGNEPKQVVSAANLNLLGTSPLDFEENKYYLSETMPIEMDKNRIVQEYGEVLFEGNGKEIQLKVSEWVETEGLGNILFL